MTLRLTPWIFYFLKTLAIFNISSERWSAHTTSQHCISFCINFSHFPNTYGTLASIAFWCKTSDDNIRVIFTCLATTSAFFCVNKLTAVTRQNFQRRKKEVWHLYTLREESSSDGSLFQFFLSFRLFRWAVITEAGLLADKQVIK